MEHIIEETIDDGEISKLRKIYEQAKNSGDKEKEITARFQYAHCLLKSKHITDVKQGMTLLKSLYYDGERTAKRDYLYYIAIGATKLKKYNVAIDCIDQFLQFEPENRQALQLKAYIQEKLTKDGLIGMAITGGAALVVGGLIGLGFAALKK